MKKWIIGIGALVAVVGFSLYLLGVYNTCKKWENEVETVYKANQSVLANSYYGPLETAGLAEDRYKDMVTQMAKVAVDGWKGATGGNAMMLWLQDAYPDIDPEIYRKMIDIGERGLGKFEKSQKDLLDRGRAYKDYIIVQPRGLFVSMMGFPKVDLEEILTPVTDVKTDESFRSKQRVKPSL